MRMTSSWPMEVRGIRMEAAVEALTPTTRKSSSLKTPLLSKVSIASHLFLPIYAH